MFEIDDVKLGRAKVVSITEARQAMATIMTDREFSYIITKNNEPVRVIVNYETLKKFQVSEDEDKSPTYESHLPPGTPLVKPAKSNRTLRGLLKEREEDLKKQSEVKLPESRKMAVNESLPRFKDIESFKFPEKKARALDLAALESFEAPEPPLTPAFEGAGHLAAQESPVEPQVPALEEEAASSEYASAEYEGDFYGMETEIPAPEDYQSSAEEPAAEIVRQETQESQAEQESLDANEETQAKAKAEEAPQPVLSDEERDYFQRFQKLYDSPASGDATSFASIAKPKGAAPVIEEDGPSEVAPPRTEEMPIKKKTSEFPSIDDLLRELEETKLTDEE